MSTPSYMSVVRDPIFPIVVEANQRAVFLNDEEVVCELGPGKYRRLRHLPLFGVKRLVRFKNHEWTMRVDRAPLSFPEPGGSRQFPAAVSAEFTVRTDYQPGLLEAAVGRFDPELLDEQLRSAAVSAVTGHLQIRMHELSPQTFSLAPNLKQWLDCDAIDIFDGLVRVERFLSVTAHPSEYLVRLNEIALEAEINIAEATSAQDVIDVEAVRGARRDVATSTIQLEGAAEIAARTGIPLPVVLDPALAGAADAAIHERFMELIKNPETLKILQREGLLRQVLTSPGGSDQAVQEEPAVLAAPPQHKLRLSHYPKIEQLLAAPQLEPRLFGSSVLTFQSRGSFATEAVIVTDALDELGRLLPDLQLRLQQLTSAGTGLIRLVPYEPTLPRFIENYYRAVAPPETSGYRQVRVIDVAQDEPDCATVRLHIDGAGPRVDEVITGEAGRRVEQLQSLLVMRRLTIEPA
jgi:hypothetical protein